jgi:class 3 adenylate cyclase
VGDRTSLQPASTEPKPQERAERRQVTVMFSDLVGSTALDPDLHRRPRPAAIISYAAVSGDRLARAAALTILSTPTWLTAKPSRKDDVTAAGNCD